MEALIMFLVSFLALLAWGVYNKRRLSPWWPGEEPPELADLRASLEALSREIVEAFLPPLRSIAVAASAVVESFEKLGAAMAATFGKDDEEG